MRRLRTPLLWLLFPLAAGAAIAFAIGWIASLTAPVGPNAGYMIVPGKASWEVQGTVAVGVARTRWRTDLLLDPGPYTREERGTFVLYPSTSAAMAALPPIPGRLGSQTSAGPGLEEKPPPWIRSVALDHAGERFKGWQARVAAFGWPLPVVYWLWDWRTETVQGGVVPDKAAKAAQAASSSNHKAIPEHALPWRLIWLNFILDSALLAAMIAALVLGWTGTRRLFRWRRGCCPRCAYVLRGMSAGTVCPECGRTCRRTPCTDEQALARAKRLRASVALLVFPALGGALSLAFAALQIGDTSPEDVIPVRTAGAIGHTWEFKTWRGGPLRNSVAFVTLQPPPNPWRGAAVPPVLAGPPNPADLYGPLSPVPYAAWRGMLRESAPACTAGDGWWVLAAWGMPMRCLAGGVLTGTGAKRSWYLEFDFRGHSFRIPTRPIWTGLAVDSVAVGLPLAGAWILLTRMLARRRTRTRTE